MRNFTLNALLIIAHCIQIVAAPSSPVKKVGLQFTAATIEDVSVFFRAQPNIGAWVGPEQYIEITNNNIRSFSKATGKPDGVLDIDSATLLGTPTSDTQLIYERWGQRWIMLGNINNLETSANPGISVVWTDGPVITKNTKWSQIFIADVQLTPSMPSSVDSPKLASDQNAVYITCDMYNPLETAYFGVSSVVIPQSSFIAGNPFNFTVFPFLFSPSEFPILGGLAQAPSPYNFDPHPQFGYIVVSPGFEFPGIFTYTNYYMLRIINPGSSSPTLFPSPATPISLAAPIFTDGNLIPHKGNLYGASGLLQNNFSNSLDTGGCHIRNHQLYFVTVGLVDNTGTGTLSGDRDAILWYQYDLTGDPTGQGKGVETESTVPVLIQSGTIYDPSITASPLNYWNPAIMTDKDNNIVIIGNVAGENSYVQAFYTGRRSCDPLGKLRNIILLTNNSSSYNFGTLGSIGQRWGDYCSISPDPCNDRDIWATNQIVSFKDGWGLLTTQLIPAH